MYRLRKWYLDLLTSGGDYLFLYFATVRLAGVTIRSLVVHVAPGGTNDPITIPLRARSHDDRAGDNRQVLVGLESGGLRIGREGCQVAVADPRATLDLTFTPVTSGARHRVKIDGPRESHILWEPIAIRYRVVGRVHVDGLRIDISDGAGYADFLESTILPPEVPVRRLFWGRVHGCQSDLAFMHASGAAGEPSWSRLILHRQGNFQESDSVTITDSSGSSSNPAAMGGYLVRAPLAEGEFLMTVKHQKTVQQASFIDQQKIRLPLLASLVKKMTRDPHGTKFLSRVDIPAWGERDLVMIDEEAHL